MKKGSAKKYNSARMCPYCKSTPRYDKKKHQYICPKCGAKVNADARGRPLGSVASKEMAYKRWYAHSMIEPLGKQIGRSNVYKYLSKVLGKKQGTVHTAKMSDIQLDILIQILEHATAEKIQERLGLKLNTESNKEDIRSIIEEVYKEKIVARLDEFDERIKLLEFEPAREKFEYRLHQVGLSERWKVGYEQSGDSWNLTIYNKITSKIVVTVPGKSRTCLIPIMNQCKVPFKVWEGQDKITVKEWIKTYKLLHKGQ